MTFQSLFTAAFIGLAAMVFAHSVNAQSVPSALTLEQTKTSLEGSSGAVTPNLAVTVSRR